MKLSNTTYTLSIFGIPAAVRVLNEAETLLSFRGDDVAYDNETVINAFGAFPVTFDKYIDHLTVADVLTLSPR